MALVFDDSRHFETLYELFKFEAEFVAGPHEGRPAFKPWSIDEVVESDADITRISRIINRGTQTKETDNGDAGI